MQLSIIKPNHAEFRIGLPALLLAFMLTVCTGSESGGLRADTSAGKQKTTDELVIADQGLYQRIIPHPSHGETAAQAEPLHSEAAVRQETIIRVMHFGRYAITAESAEGAAVQYIDRMSGPSEIQGAAGQSNGRLDAFLDRGTYKVITYCASRARGDVTLKVHAFKELHPDAPPRLLDHKVVEGELGDFQRRSYWIKLDGRKTLALEAAGRNLADMRLWKDGNWLVDAMPVAEVIEPHPGKPLMAQRLVVNLNEGLYLLVAYGGEQQPWAETSADHPFYLRMGIPKLAQAGRMRITASPFGIDRWLVPARADYYRLELEKSEPASLVVNRYTELDAFSTAGSNSFIDKKSLVPVAEVKTSSRDRGYNLVTVATEAGKPYRLQHFWAVHQRQLAPGRYWVGSLHSGYGEDSVDATAVLTRYHAGRTEYIDDRAIEIDDRTQWRRRFNLLGTLTLHFEIKKAGRYRVSGSGIEAQVQFQPFLTERHRNYRAPKFKELNQTWDLDAGFYILTIRPKADGKGIATIAVARDRQKPVDEMSPARTAIRFSAIDVRPREYYRIDLNQQPGITAGLLVRRLPIDVSEALPLTLAVGESVRIPIRVPTGGELVALAEGGAQMEFSLGNGRRSATKEGTVSRRHSVVAGRYSVSIENPSTTAQHYHLQFTPTEQLAATPLPPMSPEALNRIPVFQELIADTPVFADVGELETKTYRVAVNDPGLYRLETTGLLQTFGNLRTRVITRLDSKHNNGVGRNFLIQQYLREGDYQLTLAPEGKTQGHLGVRLTSTSLNDGGRLLEEVAARYSLKSGRGLRYQFEIANRGRYRLQCYGLKNIFRVRLEDADGWPLLKPGGRCDIDQEFYPGKYRLVVLPMALDARVVTSLHAQKEPRQRVGHGPFDMGVGEDINHVWLEPEKGARRVPDQWRFELPGTAHVKLTLSKSMQGDVYRLNGSDNGKPKHVAALSDRKALNRELPAGRYLIEVSCRRRNNLLNYQLSVHTDEILVGQTRKLSAPTETAVSIGKAGLVEISSQGRNDVKALLYDANGSLIQANDDRPHDWNFNIARNLQPGRYRLQVLPVGESSAETEISVSAPPEKPHPAMDLPAGITVENALINIYPFNLKPRDGVLAVAAESIDAVHIRIEKQDAGKPWVHVAGSSGLNPLLGVAIAGRNAAQYRLKVWSAERRNAKIDIRALLLDGGRYNEDDLAKGIAPPRRRLLSHQVAAAFIKLKQPGVFNLSASAEACNWSALCDTPMHTGAAQVASGESSRLWALSVDATQPIRAGRIVLNKDPLALLLSNDSALWLDARSVGDASEVFIATSRVGRPGLILEDGTTPNVFSMGLGRQSTIAVSCGEAPNAATNRRLKLWNAAEDVAELPVTVSRYRFTVEPEQAIEAGIVSIVVKPGRARRFTLAPGVKELQFALPRRMAAVLVDDDRVVKTFWSDRDDDTHLLTTDADALHFFNFAEGPCPLTVAVTGTATKENHRRQVPDTVSGGHILKRYFSSAGIFHFPVDIDDADRSAGVALQVYGKKLAVSAVEASGRVLRGLPMTLKDDAAVAISHDDGMLAVWLDQKAPSTPAGAMIPASLPSDIDLKHARQSFSLAVDRPMLLHMRSREPLIVRRSLGDLPQRVEVFEHGVRANLFVPEGQARFTLESVDDLAMSDVLHLQTTDISTMGEGLGDRTTLSPGQARLYQFTLTPPTGSRQEIGVGVKASVDIVRCRLFDGRGREIGYGVAQQHALPAGVYYLMVESPANAATVQVRPALVGLQRPPAGAPREVMLEYQKLVAPESL